MRADVLCSGTPTGAPTFASVICIHARLQHPAFDLTRFLVSSIAFMTHLSEVRVYFDDKRLVKLSKNCSESKEVPMLKELKGMSPEGIMNVKSIETTCEFNFCSS